MDVAIDPGFGRRRRISPHEAGIAVRQVQDEEVRLLLDPADDDDGFAEVRLRMPGWMRQRHEHLPPAELPLAHVILDDRVAAGEAVLVAQPLIHPLRCVALLAMHIPIAVKPGVDDPGEGIQLRPLHCRLPPVARRNRERHHLADAVARDIEMPRRLPLAHTLRTGQPNLPVHIHGNDPPALPAARR